MKRAFRIQDARPDPGQNARDEIAFHLDMRTREFMEQGLSAEEARRRAEASFGNVPDVEAGMRLAERERAHRMTRRERLANVRRDITMAFRSFRRRPLYAIGTVLTLALGFGAAAAVFAVVNGVILRPLPYADSERLAMVWLEAPPEMNRDRWPLSPGFYRSIGDRNTSFTQLAAFRAAPVVFGDADVTEQLDGAAVVPELFSVLGIAPAIGRTFTAAEGGYPAPNVVLISHRLWTERFGADSAVLARAITLDGRPRQIVGVMPAGFAFPRGAELPRGLAFGSRTDVWTPMALGPGEADNYGTMNLAAVARIKPGVDPASARAEAQSIVTSILRESQWKLAIGVQVNSLRAEAGESVRRGLWFLLAAVAAVLVIACTNVAGLLLARLAGREREFAVRRALGANAGRVRQQLVTESLVLTVAGGMVGAALGWWGTRLVIHLAPGNLPRADDVGFGGAVLAALAATSLLVGVILGLAGTGAARTASPAAALGTGAVRATATREAQAGRRAMVTAQMALSVLLLVAAGQLLQSFARIQRVESGVLPRGAITGEIHLPVSDNFNPGRDGPGWARFFSQYLSRLAALPGIEAAGAVSALPLTGRDEGTSFAIVGREPARREDWIRSKYLVVAGDYFRAAGITLHTGRVFEALDQADSARPAVIISRRVAQQYFPGESPIGQRLRLGSELDTTILSREIIGVVGDVKHGSLDADFEPTLYVPERSLPYPGLTVVVRTDRQPNEVVPALRRELKAQDPTIALSRIQSFDDVFRASYAKQRFLLILVGSFAAAALLLAVLGLYAVVALSVEARRRELGVRLALGAKPAQLVRLVLGDGLQLVAVGAAIGLVSAWATARFLESLLYGLSAHDPRAYLFAAVTVVLVAIIATYLPAGRAARTSPGQALAAE